MIKLMCDYVLRNIKQSFKLLLGNILWYCIISFIDGNWNIEEWYLYCHTHGRITIVAIELLLFLNINYEKP